MVSPKSSVFPRNCATWTTEYFTFAVFILTYLFQISDATLPNSRTSHIGIIEKPHAKALLTAVCIGRRYSFGIANRT